MWTYEQCSGILVNAQGLLAGHCYSGAGADKNKTASQSLHDRGPIPQGTYEIGAPIDTLTHGPYVLHLTPDPANEMFGRSAFLIHGDSRVQPGTASKGCIIADRATRQRIWDSGDHRLRVISGLPVVTDQELGL